MTITRIINGEEAVIELTEQEMQGIYWEQQHIFDKQDVMNYIDNYLDEDGDEEDFFSDFSVTVEQARAAVSMLGEQKGEYESEGNTWEEAVKIALYWYAKYINGVPAF